MLTSPIELSVISLPMASIKKKDNAIIKMPKSMNL